MSEGEPRLDFRDMTEADLAEGLRLSRASGWNQTLADWRVLLSLGPGLFRVAVQDGRVVASGGAVRYFDALAWICMILVEPERRGHGLGTRIFDEVLVRCEAEVRKGRLRGVGLDATPAGRGIYAQRGFVEAAGSVRMRVEKGSGLELCPARESTIQDLTPAVLPLAAEHLDAVLTRDRDVFGADRGPRPALGVRSAPELARAIPGRAYCFGRHGDHSDHVGPVVAEDFEARSPSSARASRSRAAGRSSWTRASIPAGLPPSPGSASASSGRSRGCTWATRGRRHGRSSRPQSSGRSSGEGAGMLAPTGKPGENGCVMTETSRRPTTTLALRPCSPSRAGWRGAPGRRAEAVVPGRDGDRDRGRGRDLAGRRAGPRPAARGLRGDEDGVRAGDRGLRGGAPSGAPPGGPGGDGARPCPAAGVVEPPDARAASPSPS